MSQQPTEICDNCQKSFPESKIATHFGYCRRNIKKCLKCGQMYDINFLEEHEEEFHKMSSCKYCKKQVKPNEVTRHENQCDARTQYCQYCDLDVPMRDYPSHLKQCEARTKQCEKCRKPIANKDFLIHTISCAGFVEQPNPTVSSNLTNKYSNYEAYLKQQKREEAKRNEYKPSYQEPKREGSRGIERQSRPEQRYSNNINNLYTNNGLRQAQIKKESIIPNKPSSQNKSPIYTDINMNRNVVNIGDKKNVPQSHGVDKDRFGKVQSNSNKNIGSIGSGKAIVDNKYVPSTRPSNEYQPSVNPYGVRKQVPTTKITTSTTNTNTRSYQPPQNDINTKQGQQIPTNSYPKPQQNFRKQIPSNKEVYVRREQQRPKQTQPKKQPNYADYQFKKEKEDPRKLQEPQRNAPKPSYVPVQEYRPYQPPREYVEPQQTPYEHNSGVNDQEMDEELQKAIMASLGNMAVSSPKNRGPISTKPTYKIDEIPPQLLENDMMNQSFYGKQQALWEEFQKNKKKR